MKIVLTNFLSLVKDHKTEKGAKANMEPYEKPAIEIIEMNEAFLTDVTSCDTKMPEICIAGDD
jgi:hypothetical protein